ncbi:MAG: putative toxin-antitoxin system toxin component, PIN family [Saprospiraceae bacterium]|nr:putative toxin-antitoxin system toxin component, PIN family [Saprospiraceae bacterium]
MLPIPEPCLVIDTNLWVSYFLGNRTKARLDKILYNETLTILVSESLLEEMNLVLSRPKFRRYFSIEDSQELLALIRLRAKLVDVQSIVSLSRDQKDDFVLALCQDGTADFLITGDADLLVLHPFGDIQIVTLSGFCAIYID